MSETAVLKLILEVVFDRFHIVIGDRFEFFDHKPAFGVETGIDRVDRVYDSLRRVVESEASEYEFQPFDFDKNTVFYETVFRKDIPEFIGF